MAEVRAFKRHEPLCDSIDRYYTPCASYCYVSGELRHQTTGVVEAFDRQSLRTRSWSQASRFNPFDDY